MAQKNYLGVWLVSELIKIWMLQKSESLFAHYVQKGFRFLIGDMEPYVTAMSHGGFTSP